MVLPRIQGRLAKWSASPLLITTTAARSACLPAVYAGPCERRFENVKVARRGVDAFHLLGPVSAGEVDARAFKSYAAIDWNTWSLAPDRKFRNRVELPPSPLKVPLERNQPVRLRRRERLEQHCVHHRENRRVRANAKRERRNRRKSKRGLRHRTRTACRRSDLRFSKTFPFAIATLLAQTRSVRAF